MGINCASISCPKLGNFAFSEDNIETALDNLMLDFINNGNRNKISENKLELSKIFDWFSIDFTKNGTQNPKKIPLLFQCCFTKFDYLCK